MAFWLAGYVVVCSKSNILLASRNAYAPGDIITSCLASATPHHTEYHHTASVFTGGKYSNPELLSSG